MVRSCSTAIRMRRGLRISGTIFELRSSPVVHDLIREHRRPRVERQMPGGEFRMAVAPGKISEPKIQIGQRDTNRQMTDGKSAGTKRLRIVFQRVDAGF